MLSPAMWHYPFRYAAAKFRRGNPIRKASIGTIKALRKTSNSIPASTIEIRPLDAPHLSFAATNSMVMEAVYWFGIRGYEGIVSELWKVLCSQSKSVLEVGANVGLFSVLGAHERPVRYTAVEPLPNISKVLRENLARNQLGFVEVLEGAAVPSDERGLVQISVPDEGYDAPVGSHLLGGVELTERSQMKIIDVKAYPISTLVEGRDLIKMDAEGIEAQLLRGAWHHILAGKPTLLIEVLPNAENLATILKELARTVGYNLFVIPEYGSEKLVPVDPQAFSATLPQQHNSKDVLLTLSSLRQLELQIRGKPA